MAMDFILNRTNVKSINAIDKNGNATNIRKVVDQNDNVLWQAYTETELKNVVLYTYPENNPADDVYVYKTYTFKCDLYNKETGDKITALGDEAVVDYISVQPFVKKTLDGDKISISMPIQEKYKDYYLGADITFQGYDNGLDISYDTSSIEYVYPTPINKVNDRGVIIYTSADDKLTASAKYEFQEYESHITSWSWQWYATMTSTGSTMGAMYYITGADTSKAYESYITKTALIFEIEKNGAASMVELPCYLWCDWTAVTDILDEDGNYVTISVSFSYGSMIAKQYDWTDSDIVVYYPGSGYALSDLAVFKLKLSNNKAMARDTLSGYFSFYESGNLIRDNVAFTAPNKDKNDVSTTAGSGYYDSDDHYAYISTGKIPDYGRVYKGTINVTEGLYWKAFSNVFSKVMKPFIYKWGNGTTGTEPKMLLGSAVNSWPSGVTQYQNHIYVAVYDYPNGSATTSMTFSGGMTVYNTNTNTVLATKTLTSVKPNANGNLVLDTGLTYDPNIDYKVILTIDPGYTNGFEGFNYTVTAGNSDMRGVWVDVSPVSGASVTYLSNYGTSYKYGAHIYFTSNASKTVRVTMKRRAVGSSTWSAWRVYSIFVNDGDREFSNSSTMLINTDTESTAAWYYKSGSKYGIEIGLNEGYEYQLSVVDNDILSYYSSILVTPPDNVSRVYNGSPVTNVFVGTEWTTTAINSSNPTIPGSYGYTLTKKNDLKIWSDDYTRLSRDKTRYLTITFLYLDPSNFEPASTHYTYNDTLITVGHSADDNVTYGGTLSARNAGTYVYTVTPKAYCKWTDGSSTAKSFTWYIDKMKLDKPTVSSSKTFTFDNTAKVLLFNSYNTSYISIEGTSAAKSGKYTAVASLDNPDDTCWSDGTTTDVTYSWSIEKRIIDQPNRASTSYTYNGAMQYLWDTYDGDYSSISGTYYATDAGTYIAKATLKYPNDTVWDTGSSSDLSISWSINKLTITKPTVSSSLTYNGSTQSPTVSGYNSTYMTQGGTSSAINAGSYSVTFTLKDTTNTCWTGGSSSDLSLSWSIGKLYLSKPTASSTSYTYSNSYISPSVSGYNSTYMTQGGTSSAKNVGSYSVTYTLKSTTNTCWSDGTTGVVSVSWSITKLYLSKPTVSSSTSFTYNGYSQSISFNSYASYYITIVGTSATNAGSYTATASLDDPDNTCWSDGTTRDVSYSWSIGKLKVEKPTISGGGFTYDGDPQMPTIFGYNSTYMTQGGTSSATNAGSYSVTFTLKSTTNTCWDDGTTGTVSLSWSIAKLYLDKPTISNTSFTYNGSTQSPTVSGYNSTYMTQGGTSSAKSVGSYSVTFTLKDTTNICWSDGTTGVVSKLWSIGKATISILDSLKVRKNGSSYEYWIDLASYASGLSFTVSKTRYDSTSTSKPSSGTTASETVTANSNGNLIGTFKPKSTYTWLSVTVTPASNNSYFMGSASASTGRYKVSSISSSWS